MDGSVALHIVVQQALVVMRFTRVVDRCVRAATNRGRIRCVIELDLHTKDPSEDPHDTLEDLRGVLGEDALVVNVEHQDREDHGHPAHSHDDRQVDPCGNKTLY